MHGDGCHSQKIDAIGRIAADCDIQNIQLIAERTEILGHDRSHRETYDIVTARAVAPLATLLEYCSPFVAVGGHLVVWKSHHIEEELLQSKKAESMCKLSSPQTLSYALGSDFGQRQLLIYEKIAPLPGNLPRAIGIAKKTPL